MDGRSVGGSRGSYHGVDPQTHGDPLHGEQRIAQCGVLPCGPRSVKLKFSEIWLHTLPYTRLVIFEVVVLVVHQ